MFEGETCNVYFPTLFLSGELRDAVKSGDYMAVKLALNSKEDYNLDQEVCFIPSKMYYLNYYLNKYINSFTQTILLLSADYVVTYFSFSFFF